MAADLARAFFLNPTAGGVHAICSRRRGSSGPSGPRPRLGFPPALPTVDTLGPSLLVALRPAHAHCLAGSMLVDPAHAAKAPASYTRAGGRGWDPHRCSGAGQWLFHCTSLNPVCT